MSRQQTSSTKIPNTPLRFLWFATRPHLTVAAIALGTVTVSSLLGNGAPYIFKMIIDAATTAMHNGGGNFTGAYQWIFVYIVVITLEFLLGNVSSYAGVYWAARSQRTTYVALFTYLLYHSHAYFSDRFSGAVTNKVSHASEGSEQLLDNILYSYYPTIISFVVSSVLIFLANLYIGYIYVGLVCVLIVLNYFFVKHRRPYVVAFAEVRTALRGQAVDITSNVSAVRQFARHHHEHKHVAQYVDTRANAEIKQWQLSERALIINNSIIVLATAAIFMTTLFMLMHNKLSLGDFVMVITVMFDMQGTLIFIGNTMNRFIDLYADIEEGLVDILVPHGIVDSLSVKKLVVSKGEIVFRNVDFAFSNERVFKKLNLTIPAGQRVGIVGESGAGKSTLINLLLRQYDLQGGAIFIDGQNIAEVTQDSLRNTIAVVPQDSSLFHRTIMDNIRYGNLHATNNEVIQAAKMAHAHEFIIKAPQGYHTYVGERGIKLSGGQRQRIAIARAILKKSKILILDEATSSLDSESEVLIQQSLHTLMQKKTVLAIAHRFSTLREMNRIVVFADGKIVQDGTHKDLMKDKNNTYARLWNHQAGIFL